MRADVRTQLYQGMARPYSDFSIEQGYELVSRYHQCASLPNALTQLESTMGQQKDANEREAKTSSAALLKSAVEQPGSK